MRRNSGAEGVAVPDRVSNVREVEVIGDIDISRFEAELAADADVIRSLQKNGDMPERIRRVDVRFVGSSSAISRLASEIPAAGWQVVQIVRTTADLEALDVWRNQTTESAAIRDLTIAALRLEAAYDVRYDGWGTIASTA
jgi:hypothetical protein